ncbi:MAG: serine/threonine-protein kinase, partial [Cyanobacteria bacterium J06649_11]
MTTKLLNNRYQVIQVLGAGGFGETFLAEDIHLPSRRRCVIKQLKPLADDPKTYQKIQQKFEREAATLEFLGEGSEQIPNLFAYFSEDGLFYLVQEWIQGQTLTDIVENQGCLNEEAVREILLSLLPILEYVHSKGIIHRDIKPDNIILRSSNRKPVLIDFGAVKETVRTVINSSGNTTKSMVIGTPGYMPIEQAVGRAVFASDIYSLGLTAIYLLTGKHPQELEANPQTGELIWEDSAVGVTDSLKQVLNQAINPNIPSRFSTASKMLYALESNSGINTVLPTSNNQNTQKTVAVSPVAGVPQKNINSSSNPNSQNSNFEF